MSLTRITGYRNIMKHARAQRVILPEEKPNGSLGVYLCQCCKEDVTGTTRFVCDECRVELCKICFMEQIKGIHTHTHTVVAKRSFSTKHSITAPNWVEKNNKSYPDWAVEEELLILEGIHLHGMGNWKAIATYLNNSNCDSIQKSKKVCKKYYESAYPFSAQETIQGKMVSLASDPFWISMVEEDKEFCRKYQPLLIHQEIEAHVTLLRALLDHRNFQNDISYIMEVQGKILKSEKLKNEITVDAIEKGVKIAKAVAAAALPA